MGKINRRTFAKTSLTLASLMALDPVEMIRECFKKLGPSVKSCHAKDIILSEEIYTPHLTEVMPGKGSLNYPVFLRELSNFNNVPLMLEHLKTESEYRMSADYIRSVGKNIGIGL